MWSKTRKAMYDRMMPKLRGRVIYDFEYCRLRYQTEPPATSNRGDYLLSEYLEKKESEHM